MRVGATAAARPTKHRARTNADPGCEAVARREPRVVFQPAVDDGAASVREMQGPGATCATNGSNLRAGIWL
jgi:hypothetical protein